MNYLVALSGGADSVALLLKMQEQGSAAAAAHCNFHLRGAESDRDEKFVRRLCKERGIPLYVQHFDTLSEAKRTGESVEMAARRLRYAWFEAVVRENGFDGVAVAHHRDDNAETLLLNLVRGTGLRGLTGMRKQQGIVVRPLLNSSREELLKYLAEQGQTFVTDSSNSDTRFQRNFIRHNVLPLLQQLNPRIASTLCETAARLSETERLYDFALQKLHEQLCTPLSDGFQINYDALRRSPAPETLLHEWLSPLGFTASQQADALTMHQGACIEAALWLATRTKVSMEVRKRPTPVPPLAIPAKDAAFFGDTARGKISVRYLQRSELTSIPRERKICAMDADSIAPPLVLRSVAAGDRFVPYGMTGSQLVSDYLTAHHRSRIDKLAALVVCDAQGIVWLVGERTAQRVAVTDKTQRVIQLSILPAL